VEAFSLVADMNYVGDNAPRLARALFEIALRNQWTGVVDKMLTVRLARANESEMPMRSLYAHHASSSTCHGRCMPRCAEYEVTAKSPQLCV
jgi:hypothetical protein